MKTYKLTKEDKELIEEAKKIIIKSRPVNLIDTGDVGAAILSSEGNVYRGVCTGFCCGLGSCGEYQAFGAMISNGEKVIDTCVSVLYDDKKKKYDVLPSCGKCREMMKQASRKNGEAWIILTATKKAKLKDLLPYPWDGSIEKE